MTFAQKVVFNYILCLVCWNRTWHLSAFLALSGVPLGRGTVGSPSWLLLRQPWLLSGSSACFLSPLRPPSARNTAVNPVLSLTPGPGEVSVMNCRAQDLPQGPSPHSQPGGVSALSPILFCQCDSYATHHLCMKARPCLCPVLIPRTKALWIFV